ncbi:D-2-hydroxyacid dehydrogenase [Peptoniphilus catoniae]|uniref:D-2-hydroxyacid dehydrogenase n=1 Tax=Peptoniphilus catoniae TaxID=1660341 RepID=UPI0010FF4991|nr:D-2-hydroxyacid dehydrogenase [Peptoniphilus catoniae]
MKALVIDKVSEKIPAGLSDLGFDVTIKILPTKDQLKKIIKDFDLLVMRVDPFIDKEILDAAENLKLIAVSSVGTNHINLEYAKEKGIDVRNSPGLNSNAVAELTIGKIFELYRFLIEANNEVKYKNNWNKYKWAGKELKGDTLGIIGFGKIGKRVAKLAKALEMNVIANDIIYEPGEIVDGIKIVDIDEILSDSDVISLHLPITDKSKHLISKKEIEKMKDGVFIINNARGGIVNEEDLYFYLKNKKVAGYGLDCLEAELAGGGLQTEDVHMESDLFELDNVYVSPHIGGNTKDAFDAIADLVLKNVKEVFNL